MKGQLHEEWLPFFLLLTLVVLSSIIIEDTPWGRVYEVLAVFTLLIFILAKTHAARAEFVLFDKKINFLFKVAIGFSLGFLLVDTILLNEPLFAFLSPLSVPKVTAPLGVLGFEVISQIFVMSLIVAEIEENFRSGALRPTIFEWLHSTKARAVFLLTAGLLIYALLPPLRIVGMGVFAFGVLGLIARFESLNDLFQSNLVKHAVTIITVASIFAVLHLKLFADGGVINEGIMVNAFMFAVIADVINTKMLDTVSSKIAHCMNNAVVMCASAGAPTIFGLVIAGVYALILWVIQK